MKEKHKQKPFGSRKRRGIGYVPEPAAPKPKPTDGDTRDIADTPGEK